MLPLELWSLASYFVASLYSTSLCWYPFLRLRCLGMLYPTSAAFSKLLGYFNLSYRPGKHRDCYSDSQYVAGLLVSEKPGRHWGEMEVS